jgi:hypothetical protein
VMVKKSLNVVRLDYRLTLRETKMSCSSAE